MHALRVTMSVRLKKPAFDTVLADGNMHLFSAPGAAAVICRAAAVAIDALIKVAAAEMDPEEPLPLDPLS
jgi:hypothetical protein